MPRRVLFLAWAPFFSGAERALLLTLRSLDPDRYTPLVVTGRDGELAAQVRQAGMSCKVIGLGHAEQGSRWAAAQSVATLFQFALRHRVSLIHANDLVSFQPGGYVARALRRPAVTHIRFPDTQAGYQWFLKPGFSLALFMSKALSASARKEAPDVFQDRTDVLYDAVEPQAPWTDAERATCRQELQLPVDRTLVALTGQIAEVKGIWDFVEAARLLASRASPPFFVVLGDDVKEGGRVRRAMEERVRTLGLGRHFTFLGFRRDAPRVVQAFDVVAVPSLVEPMGNATLEAMASGRPVVGTRVGGIPESVVDGETGLLVPPADPAALADAIGRLIRDAQLRARMSERARSRTRDVFSLGVHGAGLQAHYDRLCSVGGVRAAVDQLA